MCDSLGALGFPCFRVPALKSRAGNAMGDSAASQWPRIDAQLAAYFVSPGIWFTKITVGGPFG